MDERAKPNESSFASADHQPAEGKEKRGLKKRIRP